MVIMVSKRITSVSHVTLHHVIVFLLYVTHSNIVYTEPLAFLLEISKYWCIFATTASSRGCSIANTVYPTKYAHGFCFAVLCCGYTLTDFPISIRLTSLALWQSNDCPSASKATLMNMDKYFMWIHYERLHNHNKAKHNKTVCIFLGIYCRSDTDKPFILALPFD